MKNQKEFYERMLGSIQDIESLRHILPVLLLTVMASLLITFSGCSKDSAPESKLTTSTTEKPLSTTEDENAVSIDDTGEDNENEISTIPDSDIYLAELKFGAGIMEIGEAVNITNNLGYDNQPYFLPDNNTILFASRRSNELNSEQANNQDQTDIYAYFIKNKKVSRMTDTPESEYSPTMTPFGESVSVVRVELDSTQRLWEFPIQGKLTGNKDFDVVLPEIVRVGYHAWIDGDNTFLFLVDPNPEGDKHILAKASRTNSKTQKIATKIGRSFAIQPENNALLFVDKSDENSWKIKRYDLEKTLAVEMLPTLKGSEDMVWLDEETVLMAINQKIYMNTIENKYGNNWQQVSMDLSKNIQGEITRLAVSPDLKWLAFVVTK